MGTLRRSWRALPAVFTAVFLTVFLAGAPVPVRAGPRHVVLTVEAGVHGFADAGDHVVVRATVTSDELVDGALRVRTSNSSASTSRGLQLPAGTTKSVDVVVATSYDMAPIEVSVVDSGGRVLANKTATLQFDTDVELVGVMDQLFARAGEVPDQVDLPGGLGRAEMTVLDVDALDLGQAALDAFDTITATGGDLRSLNDVQRSELLSWVDAGGRLLLDDDSANVLLPGSWAPGSAGYALAGRGEIRMSAGRAQRGDWRSILEPSAVARSEGLYEFQDMFADPQIELAGRAGVKLPELVPLLAAVAVYALLIGPVMFLILRRLRRLTLIWVVVPVVAVLVAGTIVLTGGRFRSTGSPASSSFVQVSPAGAVSFTSALVVSRSGGSKTIDLPIGWSPAGASAYSSGPSPYLQDFSVDEGTGGAIHLELEAGQVANVAYVGPTQRLGLTTTASLDAAGNIVGTVHNDTPFALHDVAVFGGAAETSLGVLAAGSTAHWSLDPREGGAAGQGMPRSPNVWRNAVTAELMPNFGFGTSSSAPLSDLAELGIWTMGGNGFGLYPTGLVRVAGWSDERPADVDLGSSSTSRAVLTTLSPIDVGEGVPTVATVRAAIVRTPFLNGSGSGPQVYRYVLPPGARSDQLHVDLRGVHLATGTTAAVWNGTDWVDLDEPAGASTTPVPGSAVRGGVILMRITVDQTSNVDPNSVPPLGATPDEAK